MLIFEIEVVKVFLLVLVRFTGLVVSAPVLGSRNFPAMAKLGLSALAAMVVTPTLPALAETLPSGALAFAVMGVGELVIGLLIGFAITLVLAAVQVAGQIIDMLSGFALMNVFNPAIEAQVPIFGFFYFVVAALFLLATNGHHTMIRALVATFDAVPAGGFVLRPELLWEVGSWGRAMFYDGLLIAAPVAGALLVAYVSMGLLGRVVPQIHLFVVGFPVTIAMGLLMVGITLHLYLGVLNGMFDRMFRNVSDLIQGMT